MLSNFGFMQVNPAFRFIVAVDGVYLAVFTECQLPTLEVKTTPIREGGQNTYVHKLPTHMEPGNLILKSGMVLASEMFEWYMEVVNNDWSNAMREVTVIMLDVAHLPMASWTFYRAFPIKWTGPTLKTDDAAVALETLEIVHHGFEAL